MLHRLRRRLFRSLCFCRVGFLAVRQRLHCGEQQYVADGLVVGKQHDHTVDTDTQTACRGQAVFQRRDVVFVHHLRFIVALRLCTYLCGKTFVLVHRVVKLAKSIAHFACVHKELETLRQSVVGRLFLGKGAYFHGIVVDKRRLDKLLFHKVVKQLVHGMSPSALALGQLHSFCFCGGNGLFVVHIRQVNADKLGNSFQHGHLRPIVEVDCHITVRQQACAQHRVGNIVEHTLGNVHHATEIGVRLIQLYRGKLWVVFEVHALVAELTSDFVHFVKAADNQPLQVQFRSDTHVHVDVQRIVVSDERTSICTACNRVEDGRFHFQISACVQKLADSLQNTATQHKRALYLGVGDKVNVALAISRFHVLQAVELLRQRQQRLAKQLDAVQLDGNFPHVRTEHFALAADDVADIPSFECGIHVVAHFVALYVQLDRSVTVQNVAKTCLAHNAARHHTSCH